MAENQTLSSVVSKIKGEIGAPPTTQTNSAEDFRLADLANKTQQWLADGWDWPTLEQWWDIPLSPGGRFYTIATNADYGPQGLPWNKRRELWAQVKWNTVWLRLDYGINEWDFNFIDSDVNRTSDPVMRWRYNDTGQIEVWPIPASNYTFRVRGQRTLKPLGDYNAVYDAGNAPFRGLFDPNSLLDLDDNCVVYFAAAQYLADSKPQLSTQKLQQAESHMMRIRSEMPRRESVIILGGRSR